MVSTLPLHPDTTPPTQPTNLITVSTTTTSAALAWNAATDNVAVTGYDIYRAGIKVGSASTTSYTINGLTCGTTYSVGVRALDSAGNTSPQATTSTTTSPCATATPPPPSTGCEASNTGVADGVTAAYTGPTNITAPGTVIDGKNITSCITVSAANVIIRSSRVACSGSSVIWSAARTSWWRTPRSSAVEPRHDRAHAGQLHGPSCGGEELREHLLGERQRHR